MKIIDCRNMACPAPVVTAKRALAEAQGEAFQIIVDDGAPRENVTRFAKSRGIAVQEAGEEGGGYRLTLSLPELESRVSTPHAPGGTVVLVASDRLGDGPEELGRLLMKNFLITLLDLEAPPEKLLFLNTGVLLATEGSEAVEALGKLAARGVEVLSCGVCLDFFGRKDKLAAGSVTNMFTIAESLASAPSVIRL